MFCRLLRLHQPLKSIEKTRYKLIIYGASRYTFQRFSSLDASSKLRSDVITSQPSELKIVWDKALLSHPEMALNLRPSFYEKLRANGLSSENSRWCISMIDAIPREHITGEDYDFAVEALLKQEEWPALQKLMIGLSKEKPTIWERSMLLLISNRKSLPLQTLLIIFGQSCANLKINLRKINHYANLPLVNMVHSIVSLYTPESLISALDAISETEVDLSGPVASAIMRAFVDVHVEKRSPPDPSNAGKESPLNKDDPVSLIWQWKLNNSLACADDLNVFMIYLIYQRRSQMALLTYDSLPQLHDAIILNEAVLLASAGAADYERLQAVFESVERDKPLTKKLGSKRYAIVLSTLGYLGDSGVLQDIYDGLLRSHPELLTRGVFHALIHSHGVRGDLKRARKMFDTMISRGIEPTYTSFDLVLEAYKDAVDLKGALLFVGREMIDTCQFGLRDQELSLLLSLCGKRRDYKSAQFLWSWATSMIKPSRNAWNTYLHTFISANQFDTARSVLHEITASNNVGIDTLTIMMNGAGQSRDLSNYISELLSIKKTLNIVGDEGWYTSLLSALAEWGDLTRFEQVFEEMKAQGIRPHASHYAIYTQLLAKTKQFAKYQKISDAMHESRIPLNFAFIESHFRLLVSPGSSTEMQQAAHLAAINLVRDGYFDPKAAMVPRGAIPVRIIKPVVRRLIKSGQFVPAKQLLDSLRKQRVSEPSVRDDFMLWALYMEVADASKNFAVTESLWKEFLRTLPAGFSLAEPAVMHESSDMASKMPVFKLPRKYRFTFWRAIDTRIKYLEVFGERKLLLSLPKDLDNFGLSMNGRNINMYIQALVAMGETKLAFETAETARSKVPFNLSNRAKSALVSVVNEVNYHKYGSLGYMIRNMKKKQLAD